MKTIYTTTEFDKPFVRETCPVALKNIANQIGAEFVLYDFKDFAQRKLERDSDSDILWVLEAAYPQTAKLSISQLKSFYPNAKVVILGGDTIWWTRNSLEHIQGTREVDLWLDLMDEVVSVYRKLNIVCDSWMWTISESTLNSFEEYTQNLPVDFDKKELDFVSFMAISTQYRQNLVQYFHQRGYNFAVGSGCQTENVPAIIEGYRKSWFHLGSTSPSWTTGINTCKGWRDAISPSLNCLMLYDDFPDIRTKFGGGPITPLYNYHDFGSIENLMKTLREDRELYQYHIDLQKRWVKHTTLEKQFMRRFKQYGILSEKEEVKEDEKELLPTISSV